MITSVRDQLVERILKIGVALVKSVHVDIDVSHCYNLRAKIVPAGITANGQPIPHPMSSYAFSNLDDDVRRTQIGDFFNFYSQSLERIINEFEKIIFLDAGCADASNTKKIVECFSEKPYHGIGIDIAADLIKIARTSGILHKVEEKSILDINYKNRFNFVFSTFGVISLIPYSSLETAFSNIYTALQKGGYFFFDVFAKGNYMQKWGFSKEEVENCTHWLLPIKTYNPKTKNNELCYDKAGKLEITAVRLFDYDKIAGFATDAGFMVHQYKRIKSSVENVDYGERHCFVLKK